MHEIISCRSRIVSVLMLISNLYAVVAKAYQTQSICTGIHISFGRERMQITYHGQERLAG